MSEYFFFFSNFPNFKKIMYKTTLIYLLSHLLDAKIEGTLKYITEITKLSNSLLTNKIYNEAKI